eukprot:TRINITY_DN49578_c0_g1_i2.p1 TRINITY_DN49578_c0_g1~~TRINITY_DN49578_c0_g1_i2.p1  ORF type:complete len:259 (-),score=84.79 TRINITY_DN49578_c0_g1_i2:131-907(-)
MSASVAELFAEKVRELRGSQDSIEKLSHWVVFHRKRITQIVPVWNQELQKDVSGKRVLPLLYVCHEVLQASKSKGNECIEAFKGVLPEAVKHAAGFGDKYKPGIQKLCKIWTKFKFFDSDFVDDLLASLNAPVAKPKKQQVVAYTASTAMSKQLTELYEAADTCTATCEDAERKLQTLCAADQGVEEGSAKLKKAIEKTLGARKRLLSFLEKEEARHLDVSRRSGLSTRMSESQIQNVQMLHDELSHGPTKRLSLIHI